MWLVGKLSGQRPVRIIEILKYRNYCIPAERRDACAVTPQQHPDNRTTCKYEDQLFRVLKCKSRNKVSVGEPAEGSLEFWKSFLF